MVITIHQPSSRLFSKFDKLMLLSNGCSLYFGKASEAMVYFSSIGCSPLIAMSPAEFLIDLANGNINDKSIPCELEDKFLVGTRESSKIAGPSPGDVHEVKWIGNSASSILIDFSVLDDYCCIILLYVGSIFWRHMNREIRARWRKYESVMRRSVAMERRWERVGVRSCVSCSREGLKRGGTST